MLAKKSARANPLGFERLSITDRLAEHLRTRILSGDWCEGFPLKQESIAEEYEVSRMPVREVLRQLEAENLIIIHPNRGAVVAGLSTADIEELFNLRADLECNLGAQALCNATDTDVSIAEEALDSMRQAGSKENLSYWDALNWNFHEALYKPADRPHSLSIVRGLNQHTGRYVTMHLLLGDDSYEEAYQEHSHILNAYKTKNKTLVKRMIKQHILNTKADLLEALKSG